MSRHKPHLDPATGSPLHPLPPSSAATEQTLPCPFCGSETLIGDTGTCWVRCASVDCGAEGPLRDNETDAITAWNAGITNVAQAAPNPLTEACRAHVLETALREIRRYSDENLGPSRSSLLNKIAHTADVALERAAQPPAAPVEKSGVMQAAANAAEKVAGWSPSKREYAERVVGTPAAPVETYIYGGDGRSDAVETDADLPTYQDVRGILPPSSAGTDEVRKVLREVIARIVNPPVFNVKYVEFYPDRSTVEQFEAFQKADAILAAIGEPQEAVKPVAYRWRWAPNDFWKYTDENGPGVPDLAQCVEALAVTRPHDGGAA
jgi:hypothetical protein